MPIRLKTRNAAGAAAVDVKPFIPDSFWGLFYLAAAVVFSAITFAGGWREARRIAVILALNWLVVRGIASQTITWSWAPQLLPWVTAVAIAASWRNSWSYACAVLTALMVVVEQASLALDLDYAATAAVEDGLGLLALAIMAVAGFWGGGSTRIAFDVRRYRPALGGHLVPARSKTLPRA